MLLVRLPQRLRPVVAVIPARGGSKGIPRKALVPLGGSPLLVHAIRQGLRLRRAGLVDRVVVSTEDAGIAGVARRAGAEGLARPRRLATDRATGLSVLRHAVRALVPCGTVVLLQPTSPLRSDPDVTGALALFARGRADTVVSVSPAHPPPEWMFRMGPRGILQSVIRGRSATARQALKPAYALNGAVYVTMPRTVLSAKGLMGGRVLAWPMPPERSVDIDTPFDLAVASALLRRRR